MKKLLFLGIPSIAIIVVNLLYGSVISWMLSITIIASLIYFVAKLGLENIITKKMVQFTKDDPRLEKMIAFDKKWKAILSFGLLTVVFFSCVFGVYFTMDPKGKFPWFTNNEYHGLSNTGIAFKKNIQVMPLLEDSTTRGASINFEAHANEEGKVTFSNFFQPVIALNEDGKSVLLNKIFDADVSQNFSISNDKNKLQVSIQEKENNILSRLFGAPQSEAKYSVKVSSSDAAILDELNLKAPFSDEIIIEAHPLQKGMNLFNLLLDNFSFSSSQPETYQVLEGILRELGATYLLASHNGTEKGYMIFPDKSFFDNRYELYLNSAKVPARLINSATIKFETPFYIGFNNQKKLLHLANIDKQNYSGQTGFSPAIVFDYPNTYMLKSPGAQSRGDKNIRFVTNNFDNIISSNLQEGFHFTTYNLRLKESINGILDYITGGPNTPLAVGITDNNIGSKHQTVTSNKFALQSDNSNIQYLFDIRDFSQNGFSVHKTILYLGLTYLAFIILTTFFGGRKIDRIEPIVLSVILALTALRYIMFWRVATFPPLENITKYELENTLINFDFNLGFVLPFPLTLLWTVLFVVSIIFYRVWSNKNGTLRLVKIFKIDTSSIKSINKSYAVFILAALVLFFLNKKVIHLEALTRVLSILVPLIGYWYFSKIANKHFEYTPLDIQGEKSKFIIQVKAYFYYLFNNPTFFITTITLAFFALADRGFAILFALFILLKNIFVSFLKKPLDLNNNSVKRMLYKPNNYWIYGFTALIVYLVTLSFKSLFYYLLTYKLWVISAVFLISLVIIFILYPQKKKLQKIIGISLGVWFLLIAVPPTRNFVNHQIDDVIKHVQYRASIIHQPIGELMQHNEYTSFKTRKIIETAENQWFINSYISKPYDNRFTINTRPHSRVGVDYSTQTRDVVVARYIISEMGNFTMYLILCLILLPLVLYLMSYRVHLVTKDQTRDVNSYAGLVPLIILFTIALFVWLTATNRFVFFGQDFPFLSLTSRVSVIMPLVLLALTLMQTPTLQHAFKINLRNNAIKYLFFFGIIAAFALSTVKQNELNNKNFSVVMDTTKHHIDVNLNNLLAAIQDSLEQKKIQPTYNQLIGYLAKDHRFDELKKEKVKDPYTKSILDNLIAKPSSALQLNNPLFILYDNGRYSAVYNKNMYLELPPVESRKIWNGSIMESLFFNDVSSAVVTFDNQTKTVTLPFFTVDAKSNIQLALLPGSWFGDNKQQNIGIINVDNNLKGNASIFVYKNIQKNIEQNATSFASTLEHEDLATVYHSNKSFNIGFRNAGNRYALNKWINGAYKIIYPLREKNFWIYNFANAIKAGYSNETDLHKDVNITLDYDLSKNIQHAINTAERFANQKNKKYNFSVIAADGDGNVRLMADYVTNRRILDPNNEPAIYALQKQQFFFSNARYERDQWGNRNLLNLFLGPGSSIKPLTAAVVASQLNAGWERLIMNPVAPAEVEAYAGFKPIKPWKNDEHYHDYITLPKYIEVSSNFYQSLIVFLGSYSREYFYGADKKYSLKHVLSTTAGENNEEPSMYFDQVKYYLPNYDKRKGNWPATDKSKTRPSFFGNENSLLAVGFEQNANLRTKDKDKQDLTPTSVDRVNFVDTTLSNILDKNRSGGYLWSFPEQSYFLQSERASNEIHQNFNLGLKTVTLGGYPYRITPYMMLQMYMSLFSQNKNFRLGLTQKQDSLAWWTADSTWDNVGYYQLFLSQNIFKGMHDVIFGGSGTARRLQVLKSKYPNYYFYAKTGTINEQTSKGKSSRRLIVIATNKDLQVPANIGNTKQYGWYFATDNTGDFDWNLLTNIIDQSMNSSSLKYYFNK
jgi:hypothetical protein